MTTSAPLASVEKFQDADGKPYSIIIEHPEHYPFEPGERELYREATEAEYQDYVDFFSRLEEEAAAAARK